MLSRRQLRNKVLLALYAFFQSGKNDLAGGEKELLRSIDKVYDLYLLMLLLLTDLAGEDRNDAGELHTKFFPKAEELHAKHRLHQIRFLETLETDPPFQASLRQRRLSWQAEHDLVRKIFLEIKRSDEYLQLIKGEAGEEREFLPLLVRKFVLPNDALNTYLDESNLYWQDDLDFVCHMVIKNITQFYEQQRLQLFPLYKDEKEDKEFVRKLFGQTILHNAEFEKSIAEKTRNWDLERIALIDTIILKMALAELTSFPGIPVKVTINEYIDISKEYSTPSSKQFVNGVIDKLAQEFLEQGKIVKTGRGLIG
jgi:N utilization substance protein B